jgi:hypothetical protein
MEAGNQLGGETMVTTTKLDQVAAMCREALDNKDVVLHQNKNGTVSVIWRHSAARSAFRKAAKSR